MNSFEVHPIKKYIVLISIMLCFVKCFNINNEYSEKEEISDLPEGVHSAFYNSQGDKISISTTKGRIILLNDSLQVLKIQKVQDGSANSAFFSLDDLWIISGGMDKKLTILDAFNLNIERQYNFDYNSYTTIHGYNTLAGCGEGGKLLIYHLESGDTLEHILESQGAYHLFYIRPDTHLVVSSGLSGYEFDIINNKIAHVYKGHKDIVYCIMPSNDEKKIITASRDSTVKIFDRNLENCMHTSTKLDGAVYVACFHPNDSLVAASTSTGSIYFMDITLNKVFMKLKAFDTRINTIHFSPNGTKILAGSEGGGAKIFSVENGELLYSFDEFP